MQENADDLVDPSRSSQEDSPSVFPHSFKLRKRLEKLAQWRIDPSLIEFPADVREFRGGFATVSQGRLVSSSRADGGAIQSKHFTGEHPSSVDKEGLQSDKATQEAGTESEGKNEEAAARKVDSGNDHPREEGPREADNDKEHESPRQTSITKIGSETSISHRIVNADPDPGDHDHQSLSLTKDNENDQQGEVEGPVSRIPEGTNNEAKEQAKNESKNSKDQQDRDDETYKQVRNGSACEI
ncbi:hypothetical protein FS837_008188 [Tulasnella sp. UAMH 9824]|nr:hypothetical protein FS837_008188 [Tulasnella sp. UAMH 9824]